MNETTRIQIDLSPEELAALDRWRAANGLADREQAIRRLVQLGLKVASGPGGEADIDAAPD